MARDLGREEAVRDINPVVVVAVVVVMVLERKVAEPWGTCWGHLTRSISRVMTPPSGG